MIILIIKCYFLILLSITVGALFILIGGLYLIFRKRENQIEVPAAINTEVIDKASENVQTNSESSDDASASIKSQDIHAIAGDDIISTQLDLARAYIESDKQSLAKKILEHVAEFGKLAQQKEAHSLLAFLNSQRSE